MADLYRPCSSPSVCTNRLGSNAPRPAIRRDESTNRHPCPGATSNSAVVYFSSRLEYVSAAPGIGIPGTTVRWLYLLVLGGAVAAVVFVSRAHLFASMNEFNAGCRGWGRIFVSRSQMMWSGCCGLGVDGLTWVKKVGKRLIPRRGMGSASSRSVTSLRMQRRLRRSRPVWRAVTHHKAPAPLRLVRSMSWFAGVTSALEG